METLCTTTYLHILLHRTTHHTLEMQRLNFVPSTDFRQSIELLRLLRTYQPKALLADNRLLQALHPADLEWSGNLVFHGLSELGAAASPWWSCTTP